MDGLRGRFQGRHVCFSAADCRGGGPAAAMFVVLEFWSSNEVVSGWM